MPTTLMGKREEVSAFLPMDEVEPLSEALAKAVFNEDSKQVDILCSSFLKMIGLSEEIVIKFNPMKVGSKQVVRLDFKVKFGGEEYIDIRSTRAVAPDEVPLATNKNIGAWLLSDIFYGIRSFIIETAYDIVYDDVSQAKLYDDAVFKAGDILL